MTRTFAEIIADVDTLSPAEQARLVQIIVAKLVHFRVPAPVNDLPLPTPEELGWPPGFFEQTYGALADIPLVIDDEGVDASLDDDPDEIVRQLDEIYAQPEPQS